MSRSETLSWPEVRRVVRGALSSSLHCSIATLNEDGSPHVTPIGSVMLTRPGRGLYFEIFANQLGRNLDRDPRLCLLAVDSRKRFWLTSLRRGRFSHTPAVRLLGQAGPRRDATPDERHRFERAVRPLRFFKGYRLLWRNTGQVRDLTFDLAMPVRLGAMTADLPTAASAFTRVAS